MPRALWRRRPTTDNPRPAGRRRGGVLARGVRLVRRSQRGAPVAVGTHPSSVAAMPPSPTATAPAPAATAGPAATGPLLTQPGPAVTVEHLATPHQGGARRHAASPAASGRTEAPASGAGAADPWLLTGERTLGRRARFALANGCTLGSLGLGVLAILLAMRGEVQSAALCVIACVAFDGLDGMLARRLGVATPFGAQMDSLADMCSFGIAAPVVVYAWLAGSVPEPAAAVACALVAACSAIRLARFNVRPRDGRFFSGVPTTMAAAVLALLVLMDLPVSARAQLLAVALLGVAMVSSFPYASVARLLRLPVWLWLLPLVGVLVDVRITFALVVGAYLVSGPLLWLHWRRAA